MRAGEHPERRLVWRAMAIMAAAALLMLGVADTGIAKKKPFKPGTYRGQTSQNKLIQFEAKKKQVLGLLVDFPPPPGCQFVAGGCSTGYAGLQAEIERKKKKGTFKALSPGNGYYGNVQGTLQGKKAEGTAVYDPQPDPDLPALPVSWKAKRCKSPTAPC